MTTIVQKMWRDGVTGPDGNVLTIPEREQTCKCVWCGTQFTPEPREDECWRCRSISENDE